jgi:hypothetical protein
MVKHAGFCFLSSFLPDNEAGMADSGRAARLREPAPKSQSTVNDGDSPRGRRCIDIETPGGSGAQEDSDKPGSAHGAVILSNLLV